MSKLCERPGCSEPGAAVYGMIPEDLLFWIVATDTDTPADAKLLCRRHADAMVVPRGWTLDDRRQPAPSLFQTRRYETKTAAQATLHRNPAVASGVLAPPSTRRQVRHVGALAVEQLQIDGTGPIPRPAAEMLAAIPEPIEEPIAAPIPAPVEPEPEREPVVEAEPVVDSQPDMVVEPAPKLEPEPAVEPEPEPVVEADPVVEAESTLESEPVVEPELAVDPEPEPELVVDPEPAVDPEPEPVVEAEPAVDGTNFGEWRPEFDTNDDLDGLLETKSPLLSRAFRGVARQR